MRGGSIRAVPGGCTAGPRLLPAAAHGIPRRRGLASTFRKRIEMAEDEGNSTEPQQPNGNDTAPQVGVISQYVKDLSFENPNSPAVYQWQTQPQDRGRLQHRHRASSTTRFTKSRFESRSRAKADGQTAFAVDLLYAGLIGIRNVDGERHPGLPARRGAANPLPLRPADRRPDGSGRRLPAADARPDRLPRPLHAARAAQETGGEGAPAGEIGQA